MGGRLNDPSLQRGAAAHASCAASWTRSSRRRTSRSAPRSGSGSPPSWPTTCSGYGPLQRLLDDPAVTEIMVNGPDNDLRRAAAASWTRTGAALHLRGAPAPGHRADRLPGRPAHRRVLAAGRRPPGRRLPRQRDHPAAGLQRVLADHPQVLQGPVQGRRPDRLRHPVPGDGRAAATPASRPGSTSSSPAAPAPARRRCSTCSPPSSPRASASSPSRTPSSCSCSRTTSSGWSPGRPNIEGKGAITIRDLVRNSLRMRPDRIVVGECRGGETLDMLQAMNTGHDGSLSTVHANSPARRHRPPGDAGADGRHGPAAARHPRADRLGRRRRRPAHPAARRHPPGHARDRGAGHGGGDRHPPGRLPLRLLRRRRRATARSSASRCPPASGRGSPTSSTSWASRSRRGSSARSSRPAARGW